jgi:hypothetical protein
VDKTLFLLWLVLLYVLSLSQAVVLWTEWVIINYAFSMDAD